MFELLFNYPLALWRQGTLDVDAGLPLWALLVAVLVAAVCIVLSLQRLNLGAARRAVVATLQCLLVALVLTMIWQPVLRVSVSERGENTVAWLLDSSRSMSLIDEVDNPDSAQAAASRFDTALEALQELSPADSDRFSAQLYNVAESLQPADSLQSLARPVPSARSNLAPALEQLLATVGERSLAAVVLLSDGADNSASVDNRWWQSLAAAGVPVHTVGVGQAQTAGDLELVDVSLPAAAQPNTEVTARLRIRHAGQARARVRVMAGDTLLAAQDIQLPADAGESIHSVQLASGERGIRSLEFSVEPAAADDSTAVPADPRIANNRRPAMLRVDERPGRVLYIEGEPRWEYKFIRRALDTHPGVDVVSLLRTSPNKFYRQGVRDGEELADGFPQSREQLFAYEAIIIGSLEAAELSSSQQADLRDFVSQRGGTLVMLAGRHGLADGGWGRSVVAAALPVQLGTQTGLSSFNRERTEVIPSLSGLRTPWLQLEEGTQANLDAWRSLPAVADHQSLGQVKPGAVVLLQRQQDVRSGGLGQPEPLLVAQRYGRGQSLVMGSSGTWRWQMSLPSQDLRHERFWRQLLSMAVDRSLPRLQLHSTQDLYRDQDLAELELIAYNADYTDLQVSELPMSLTGPDGQERSLMLYPDSSQPGRYLGQVPMDADGPWTALVSSPLQGESPSAAPVSVESWWVSESGNAEDFGSQLQADFLTRISEVTGGSYLPLSEIARLDQLLATDNAALKRENLLPLWNMPILFLLILLLKLLEWGLRLRWKRL